MNKHQILRVSCCAMIALASSPVTAITIPFTKLAGLTGTAPNAETAVYSADLSGLSGTFAAISITDVSASFGGSPGRFSGFDLDAIKISSTNCATAACAASAAGLSLFDFVSGVVFTHGTQRAPTNPVLFGTGPTGSTVDNTIATLGQFDGLSDTAVPDGFISLGDGGSIAFNLTSPISGAGLFLYVGEVGDNGEVAGSNIDLLSDPVSRVPEAATWVTMLMGFGLVGGVLRSGRTRVAFIR